MTKADLFNIAIKIFGLFYFVRFVQHFMEFLFMIFGNTFWPDMQAQGWYIYVGIFVTLLVDFVFAYLAIFRTSTIVTRISSADEGTVALQSTKTDLLEIGLAIIAVLAILNAIPDLLTQQVNSIYYYDHKETEFWNVSARNHLFRNLFVLGAGVFLL